MQRLAIAWVLLAGLGAALPAGAQAPVGSQLMRKLLEAPRATRGDCILAVGVFLDGRQATGDLATVVERLKVSGVLKGRDAGDLDLPATRGYACLLFKRVMGEKGGLVSRVFARSERYAYRHLCWLNLVPAGGAHLTLSGPELAGLLSLAKRHVTSRGVGQGGRA